MTIYKIRYTSFFSRQYRKLISKNSRLEKRIDKTVEILKKDPQYSGIHSHKVDFDKELGNIYSSRVTGDIRILWAYDKKFNIVIVLLDIGTHDHIY